jgi:hypothetical protein
MDAAVLAENIRDIVIDGSDDTPVLDEHGHGCTRADTGSYKALLPASIARLLGEPLGRLGTLCLYFGVATGR